MTTIISNQSSSAVLADVTMQLCTYDAENCTHIHDYCQWVLPLAGSLELEIANKAGIVTMDHGAFIAPYERHCFASKNENLFLVLDVMPNNNWVNNIVMPRFWSLTPTLKKFLQFAKFFLVQEGSNSISNFMVQDFLLKLLSQIFLADHDNKVLLAKNWLDTNFASPIDINRVAKHVYLSASQLQRRFKRVMGQGIAEYWRAIRLQHAQMLLNTQKLPIEVIANKVGYEKSGHF